MHRAGPPLFDVVPRITTPGPRGTESTAPKSTRSPIAHAYSLLASASLGCVGPLKRRGAETSLIAKGPSFSSSQFESKRMVMLNTAGDWALRAVPVRMKWGQPCASRHGRPRQVVAFGDRGHVRPDLKYPTTFPLSSLICNHRRKLLFFSIDWVGAHIIPWHQACPLIDSLADTHETHDRGATGSPGGSAWNGQFEDELRQITKQGVDSWRSGWLDGL